jgi:SAM-dependent methyltransferase
MSPAKKAPLRKRIGSRLHAAKLRLKVGTTWKKNAENLESRVYKSYQDYLAHQKDKVTHLDLSEYDVKYRAELLKRLKKNGLVQKNHRILCLAARIGTEVKAFMDLGCFAVGIDLNPGNQNKYVTYGDFHDLQFADASVDVVFTNSLDHSFDIEKIVTEVKRVLVPGGLFIVEAEKGRSAGSNPRFYESFWWSSTKDLVQIFERNGFKLSKQTSFTYPWPGEHLALTLQGKKK